MKGSDYFIEQFKDNKGQELSGPLSEIKHLERNLKITAGSPTLKTIAVWQIKLKPGVKIPQPE